jgi:hypothetical protein
VLQRIAAGLAVISTAAGYFTNAGAAIDLEGDPLSPGNVFPRIALAEDTSEVTNSTLQTSGLAISTPLKIVVEGYVPVGADNAEQLAHRLKWDLTCALARLTTASFDGIDGARVAKFEITGDRPTLRKPDGVAFVVVQVRATATLATYFPPA